MDKGEGRGSNWARVSFDSILIFSSLGTWKEGVVERTAFIDRGGTEDRVYRAPGG